MNTTLRNILCAVLSLAVLSVSAAAWAADGSAQISTADKEYLAAICKATFRGIAFFVHEKTGLPYDVSDLRRTTSISNIGLYLASVAVANRVALISKEEAVPMIEAALSSLEKAEKWHGFPVTWIDVDTLKRGFGPSFSYADHVGNLICGLLVVGAIFPEEFGARVDDLIKQMDFTSTYEPSNGWLKGGYNLTKNDFDVKQNWGEWYYNLAASDTRPFSLFGIALGQIPEEHWSKLNRDTTPCGKLDWDIAKSLFPNKINNMPYYAPGMEGGGLFMQYMPGLFLKERDLPMGASAKNLARAQIEFARKNGYYPLWGNSSCESPDGRTYIGWAALKETVVTPHAAVLAVEDHTIEVLESLRALESNGARQKYKYAAGEEFDFGFTDSYDIVSKTASRHYLALDQCMVFLSLANFLCDGAVRTSFDSHPLGKKTNELMLRLEKNNTKPEWGV